MIEIELRDFRGCERASLRVDPIALIAGRNATGKSSIAQAIGAALTGDPLVVEGVAKGVRRRPRQDRRLERERHHRRARGQGARRMALVSGRERRQTPGGKRDGGRADEPRGHLRAGARRGRRRHAAGGPDGR